MARGFRTTREDWVKYNVPEGAERLTADGVAAECYVWTSKHSGKPVYACFGGKRSKPDLYYRARSLEEAHEEVKKYLERQAERAAEKAERRAERNEFKTDLVPGDILYTSWGYEQTNVSFYKVLEVSKTGKTLTLVKVGHKDRTETSWMAGKTSADPDNEIGEPFKRRASPAYRGGTSVRIHESATAWKWNGKPKYWSSYH